MLSVALLVAGCAGAPSSTDADATSTTVAATQTTAPPTTVAGVAPTATGAGGGGRDDRIGPPGDGQPAFEPLVAGECFNEVVDPGDGATHRMEQASCDTPHDAEVFARFDLPHPAGAPFPGEQAVRRDAYATCLADFATYVGTDYAVSTLRVAALRPVASSWTQGDRAVLCSLYDGELNPLVGPLWGSRR